jgi:aspartyl-tRNA(Asn)/glutamyl-tRNA(Gln) amidotransferase subunit A
MSNTVGHHWLTIHEASKLLYDRQLSSHELTLALLERIEILEPSLQAFVTVTADQALDQAKAADRRLAKGEGTPITGIPMQIKDNMCTADVLTTCASRMLHNFVPPYSATVVERLFAEGAVMLGKGNMDEFAMGSSTENSALYPTRNPWDTKRVPGGSSGGPAAAVAGGEAIYALGSDTGGSIRQPAAFCGIVGLKPTYGLVSRYGLVAFASSLDQIGPMTRDVTDSALVLNAIAGHDRRDSTSIPFQVPDYTQALIPELHGFRIGVAKECFSLGIEPGVESAVLKAISVLEELGAQIDWDASLSYSSYALAVYYIIAPSEASANLARYDGVKYGFSHDGSTIWEALERTKNEGFGPEVKRRIMLGTHALSTGYYDAYYKKAQQVRTLIRSEFHQAFEKYDAIVGPVSPTTAFTLGEKLEDPVQMYLSDTFTIPGNIAGIPALSVPIGFNGGLPVGLHLMARPLDEEKLLQIAFAYEQATTWHTEHPEVTS